jgi:probable 2-oxoglutarate dehydrogenase E1 component DHKTD1
MEITDLFSPVSALDPSRYGLQDGKAYPLTGILNLPPRSSSQVETREETGEGSSRELPLSDIVNHLMDVYVGKIGYEYQHSPDKSERL